jgi:hypothetical protein
MGAFVVLISLCLITLQNPLIRAKAPNKQAKANLTLSIYNPKVCILNLVVYPEKRIPRSGNWDTRLEIEIHFLNNGQYMSAKTNSNEEGKARVDLCKLGYNPVQGVFNLYIRGYSHLTRLYQNIPIFLSDDYIVDLTDKKPLLAGETSNIMDNKINSLDASTQIRAFYAYNNEKNDLNQDSKVNSLDFSNTVFNFYKLGDSPVK